MAVGKIQNKFKNAKTFGHGIKITIKFIKIMIIKLTINNDN